MARSVFHEQACCGSSPPGIRCYEADMGVFLAVPTFRAITEGDLCHVFSAASNLHVLFRQSFRPFGRFPHHTTHVHIFAEKSLCQLATDKTIRSGHQHCSDIHRSAFPARNWSRISSMRLRFLARSEYPNRDADRTCMTHPALSSRNSPSSTKKVVRNSTRR